MLSNSVSLTYMLKKSEKEIQRGCHHSTLFCISLTSSFSKKKPLFQFDCLKSCVALLSHTLSAKLNECSKWYTQGSVLALLCKKNILQVDNLGMVLVCHRDYINRSCRTGLRTGTKAGFHKGTGAGTVVPYRNFSVWLKPQK